VMRRRTSRRPVPRAGFASRYTHFRDKAGK
jgi:hypothetical protein